MRLVQSTCFHLKAFRCGSRWGKKIREVRLENEEKGGCPRGGGEVEEPVGTYQACSFDHPFSSRCQ